ncbi:AraC family transcriptional regulator [Prauserella shujinwangii]|uniref:AraC family transcriptional regulator n=1 Tax=Prauserella shujinwangii TaxID=1453103 RepID=A0A2T0M358_9PSEU|nr:helix-turn-helix domain-containing protein [Prauserella shujinwangii]PRX51160.1 AraC family transcriptional regulator [Prauserella shujinwangii]
MTPAPGGALPETCRAALWLWAGGALYSGPSLRLDPHSGSVDCLAVGVDAGFTVHTVPARDHDGRTARSALIGARLPHRLVAAGERMVFCYLDPASARGRACRSRMGEGGDGLWFGHADEAALAGAATAAALGAPGAVARWLELAAPAVPVPAPDNRIVAAAARLRGERGPALAAAQLAAESGLSLSRFLRLFRRETGTSFRRYRLWSRMLRAGSALATGGDLTTAAAEAGFASPSHFSDSFRAMFGLAPSALLGTGVTLRVGTPRE